MQSPEFYQTHLNQTSRSFAFCIARLKQPLRGWISLSYLLCRVLDTAEDSAWDQQQQKLNSFLRFEDFLNNSPSLSEIQEWSRLIPTGIKHEERLLVNDFHLLLQDFHNLPDSVREKLRRSIVSMSKGMSYFSERSGAELHLKSLIEVNQYCFFVAGLVGELLTDVIKEIVPETHFPEDIYLKAHHFGLFLQKINILKDQKEDQKNQRFFVPDQKEFLASLKQNATGAIEYILYLPTSQKEFRLFCAWSLFIGLSSLGWIQKSWLTGVATKLPRWVTEKLIQQIEDIIDDNQAVQKLFSELLPQISPSDFFSSQQPDSKWSLARYYQGHLKTSQLFELGVI